MDWDKQTEEEWNELGFYYEYDDSLSQWRVFGSKTALLGFADLVACYANNESNNALSEHLHIGPYSYLKLMTWDKPLITKDYIAGSLNDLLNLSKLIVNRLLIVDAGQLFKISDDYSMQNTSTLVFIVMADDFRPSSIEF